MKLVLKYIIWLLIALAVVLELLALFWFIASFFSSTYSGVGYLFPMWFIALAVFQIYFAVKRKVYWKYGIVVFLLSFVAFVYLILTHLTFGL